MPKQTLPGASEFLWCTYMHCKFVFRTCNLNTKIKELCWNCFIDKSAINPSTKLWSFAPFWVHKMTHSLLQLCTKLQLSLIILYPIIPLEQASWVQTLFKRISTLLASLNGFMTPWDLVWHLRNLIFLQQLLGFGISWWMKECPPRTWLLSTLARNSKKDLWHTRQMYLVPQTSRMFQVHIAMKILSQITYAACLLVNPWKYMVKFWFCPLKVGEIACL